MEERNTKGYREQGISGVKRFGGIMKKLLKKIFIKLYNRFIEPENVKWEEKDYGNIEMADTFNVAYSNNYIKICKDPKYHVILSLISFEIIINANYEIAMDIIDLYQYITSNFIEKYNLIELEWSSDYKYITIRLRGNISIFKQMCLSLNHNIFVKYIRNYLFPKNITENNYSVEERFDNEYIYGLDNPNKDIDILFIENDNFKDPLIGLSLKNLPIELQPYHVISYNNRSVVIIPIKKIDITGLDLPERYNNIISNIHTNIDPYNDIDEIIEG